MLIVVTLAGAALIMNLTAKTSTTTSTDPTLANRCDGLAAAGQCYALERAVTNEEHTKGLSGRDNLASQTGMLFVFSQPKEVCIWMKDMRFNLDIVWLNESKTITKIGKNVSPDTYPSTFCSDNTKYVIELNSGDADKLQLKFGDSLGF